jgi:hypothetical protein
VLKEDRCSARDGSAYATLRGRGRGRDIDGLVAGSLRVILMGDKGKVIWFVPATHDQITYWRHHYWGKQAKKHDHSNGIKRNIATESKSKMLAE